ncbi:MAG: hypothetical protein U0X91_05930 [Spirosomataceae bacterium]
MKIIYGFILLLCFLSCHSPKDISDSDWQIALPGVTSLSSPRVTDLNRDGVLDIVLGGGSKEWSPSDSAYLALNGRNGAVLWHVRGRNQIYGSATFIDLNRDGIQDVIMGGRSAELKALDGQTGETLWEFFKTNEVMGHKKAGWFNFSNVQLIPDLDADGLEDMLIANGGDATIADNYSPRPVGRLLILSSQNGKVLHEARVPDGKETYLSPVLIRNTTDFRNWTLLFGTGGEAIGGSAYKTTLGDLLKNDLTNAQRLTSDKYKGILAPPLICDVNSDGISDYVFNLVTGKTQAVDGKTHELLWEFSYPRAETFSMPAIGYFTGNDRIPDFFVSYAVGVYPYYSEAFQFLLDGKDGHLVQKFQSGSFSYASPLTLDYNNDGFDDAVLPSNYEKEVNGKPKAFCKLTVYDFLHHQQITLADSLPGANFAITPWIGDLDNDGKLDIVYGSLGATTMFYPGSTPFEKPSLVTYLARKKLTVPSAGNQRWGAYMGTHADCRWSP